MTGDVTINEFY